MITTTHTAEDVRIAVVRAAAAYLAYRDVEDVPAAANAAEAALQRRPDATVSDLAVVRFTKNRWGQVEALAALCATDSDPAAWADDFDGDLEVAAGAAVAGAAWQLGM